MNYIEVLSYLKNSNKFAKTAGLDRIKALMVHLGNPQDELKFIHVAGTNGKGSVSSFLAGVLKCAGLKTGLFTSPFIYQFNERIQINNEQIPDHALADIMTQVRIAADYLINEGSESFTEFELITAAAFLYFYCQKCDIVVLEVGLGGRFDATNVIKWPLLSVITSISFDHMEHLGGTLSEIAFEKCGIIKETIPVVCYPKQPKEAYDMILHEAGRKGSRVICNDLSTLAVKKIDLDGSIFDALGLHNIKIRLCGEHQIYNSMTAIFALLELRTLGIAISDKEIKDGLLGAKWPGRFEYILKEPNIIVDGAHNSDGMRSFVDTAKSLLGDKKVIVIWAMLKGKEHKRCAEMLGEICSVLITTRVPNPRSEEPDVLMSEAEALVCDKYITENVNKAVNKAFELYDNNSIIFGVGSLYLISDLKNACMRNNET